MRGKTLANNAVKKKKKKNFGAVELKEMQILSNQKKEPDTKLTLQLQTSSLICKIMQSKLL